MPKVYLNQEERRKDAYRRRIKNLIKGKMAELGHKNKDLVRPLGISESGISRALTSGSLSLLQMMQLNDLLQFNESDLARLFKA